jgi:hypothetical protein
MTRPTPETDAEGYGDGRHPWVATEFARKLERERDDAREQNAKLRDIAERALNNTKLGLDSIQRENQLRAELDQLKEGAK